MSKISGRGDNKQYRSTYSIEGIHTMNENEHYYSEHPTSAIREREFTQKIKNEELTLSSVSGVFAFEDRVDRASQLLIEAFTPSGASVLDLGCGYGAVGLFVKAMSGKQ
jgi:16S rRNA G1207 methylase RsmC